MQLLPPKGEGETLLVAEDDPAVRSFIRTVLEEFGYSVIEAVDGIDAVKKFRENSDRIKATIFDIIMPKKTEGMRIWRSKSRIRTSRRSS